MSVEWPRLAFSRKISEDLVLQTGGLIDEDRGLMNRRLGEENLPGDWGLWTQTAKNPQVQVRLLNAPVKLL